MNFRNNINYFKKKDSIKTIGGGLLIIGLFWLWLGIGYIGWIAYFFMILSIPTGFIMFILGSTISSNEGDIDEYIKKNCEGLEVDLENDKIFSKRILKNREPNVTEGYEYNGEGLMFRKDKRGTWRSSKYTKSIIYVLSDELCINSRTFSIVSDEIQNRFVEIPYETIESVEMKQEEHVIVSGKNSVKIKKDRLVIKYGEGMTFSTPMNNDIRSEEFIEMLNKTVSKAKTPKEE